MLKKLAQGKLITLEGMDGAGKSTHIPSIIAQLQATGIEVVATREPGGTPLGEQLRALLLHEAMHPETETLLMFAARREHIANVIAPALARGAYVLSDRFTDATYAYQCGGKGVASNKIKLLETWVQGQRENSVQPDLTLLFDVPVEVSMARLASAREPDKFEREGAVFFEKLRNTYLARAAENPQRFCVINSDKTLENVKSEVNKILKDFILNN